MGNSTSLPGQPAAANLPTPDAEALHGPARLPLALMHAISAHAAAEAPTPLANPTSNTTTPSSTIKQDLAAQQAGSTSEEAHKPAASLSSSSRSSSIVSLSSRGFTNDDTMPWRGSPHGSHGSMRDLGNAKSEGHVNECEDTFVHIPDEDRCLQCSLMLPAAGGNSSSSSSAANMRLVANPSLHAGQLFMHPKSGTASAEQVVWALPQQQLLSTLLPSTHCSSDAAAAATAPAMQLVSPAFVLPCPAVGGSSSSDCKHVMHKAAAQHVKTEWCLVLHPSPPTTSSPCTLPDSSSAAHASTLTNSSSSNAFQLSLRANWSAATLPDVSSLTQQLQQQQKAAPAGPIPNASAQQQQLGSSGSGASTAVAAMHGWQLQCAGRVELVAPACSTGAAAAAGAASSAVASDFHMLLQHSNQAAGLPFTICLDFTKLTSTSSSTNIKTTAGSFAHQALDQNSSSSSSGSSDTNRARDRSRKADLVAAGETTVLDDSAGKSKKKSEREMESDDKVLRVLLTFKQLQLLPTVSITSDTGVTSASSDSRQAEQQRANSASSAPVQSTGPSNSSSSSSSKTSSQVTPALEPHCKNAQDTAAPIATPITSSSSSTVTNPPTSNLTGNLKQLHLNSSTPNSTAAAAAAAEPAAACPAAAIPATMPAAAAAPVIERRLEAVLLSTAPRLLVVDDFFDAGLCDGLTNLAHDKLVRSRVASGSETPSRTSWSHFFVKDAAKHPLVAAAEGQIEALFACPALRGPHKPLAKIEALQVVKYHKGEFYHEHYDNRADSPLTRAATIIVYLCDTDTGGATSFPRAVLAGQASGSYAAAPAGTAAALPGLSGSAGFGVQGCGSGKGLGFGGGWQLPRKVSVGARGVGIKVYPVRGRAVIFWSKRIDGNEDPNSIHAADTVEQGQKWIATRWMKDDPQ